MSIYNRVLIHRPRWPLPGRGVRRQVLLIGEDRPIVVRSGTSDWYALEEVFLHHEYGDVQNSLGKDDVKNILDLGANVGMSVRLWQSLYPRARIVAVEPDPENVGVLKANTGLDAAASTQDLTVLQVCVAGTSRKVSLDRSRGEYAYRMSDSPGPREDEIDALTVSQILELTRMEGTIDLLKCDIEGAEAEVFANCSQWIANVKNLVIELHEPYTIEKLSDDLKRAGSSLEIRGGHNKGGMEVLYLSTAKVG